MAKKNKTKKRSPINKFLHKVSNLGDQAEDKFQDKAKGKFDKLFSTGEEQSPDDVKRFVNILLIVVISISSLAISVAWALVFRTNFLITLLISFLILAIGLFGVKLYANVRTKKIKEYSEKQLEEESVSKEISEYPNLHYKQQINEMKNHFIKLKSFGNSQEALDSLNKNFDLEYQYLFVNFAHPDLITIVQLSNIHANIIRNYLYLKSFGSAGDETSKHKIQNDQLIDEALKLISELPAEVKSKNN